MKASLMLMGVLTTAGSVFADTPTGWWTGNGTTFSTLEEANWEGGKPDAGTISFAKGGSRAELGEDLTAANLLFETPDAIPEFNVSAADSAANAKVLLSGDLTMSAGTVAHTNTVNVPVAFGKEKADIIVSGSDSVLVLNGSLQKTGGSIDRGGAGTAYFNMTDSTFNNGWHFYGGINYVKGGSLGTSSAWVQVNPNGTTGSTQTPGAPVEMHFAGGSFPYTFTFTQNGGNGLGIYFESGTTNTVGYWQRQTSIPQIFYADSSTTFSSTFLMNHSWAYNCDNRMYSRATLNFTGTLNAQTSPLRLNSYGTVAADRNYVTFSKAGNFASKLYLSGPVTVKFDADFAFDTKSGVDTKLGLMYRNTGTYGVRVDLNGHSQRFQLYMPPYNGSQAYDGYVSQDNFAFVTSAVPATIYAAQVEAGETLAWDPTFEGAVSLVKEGAGELVLGRPSLTTGTVEVVAGRLSFKDVGTSAYVGSMRKVSRVTISGGALAVGRKDCLPDKTEYRFSGGKLEIAAGVRLRASTVYVSDGDGGWVEETGIFTAATHPDLISGEGSLSAKPGLCLILR